MRVCKNCHNNMITVDCDRPRPLYRPFSNDVTAAILVFTNNEKLSFGKCKDLLSFEKVNMVLKTTFFLSYNQRQNC